jgi:hypothetical protein
MALYFPLFGLVEAPEGSEGEYLDVYRPLEWRGRKPLVSAWYGGIEVRVYRTRTKGVRFLEVASPLGGWTRRGLVYWPLRFTARAVVAGSCWGTQHSLPGPGLEPGD